MFHGQLIGIFTASRKGDDLQPVERIEAVSGHGLVGDRYFNKEGTFSAKDGAEREVTLIESEALEGLAREYKISLEAAQTRRNLLTRGVPLNHLVGRTFAIGDLSRTWRFCIHRLPSRFTGPEADREAGAVASALRQPTTSTGSITRCSRVASLLILFTRKT